MKKRVLGIVLAASMVFTLAACGSTEEKEEKEEEKIEEDAEKAEVDEEEGKEEKAEKEEEKEEKEEEKLEETEEKASGDTQYKVAYCTMTTEGDYWNYLYGVCEDYFADAGAQMDLIDADMDMTRQIEQIENCVTQGYDLILELPVDETGLIDVNARAMDAGIPIVQFIKDSGEEGRTAFRGTDETAVGTEIVDIAMDWVNETWPDAEDGSINTVIIGGNGAGSETERYEAMCAEAEKYPQLNILDEVRWETSQSYAQDASENEITKFGGDIQLFIVGSGEMALGVRNTIMSEGSPIKDYGECGVFSCDISAESADAIRAAANDEDVLRACVVNGGDGDLNMQGLVNLCMNVLNGDEYDSFNAVEIGVATADNLDEFGY